jgi:hypothetical protein
MRITHLLLDRVELEYLVKRVLTKRDVDVTLYSATVACTAILSDPQKQVTISEENSSLTYIKLGLKRRVIVIFTSFERGEK